MRDQMLAPWLRLLALHVEETVEAGSLARTIRDNWLLQSRYAFNGCMWAGLEEATGTPEGMSVVRGAIASLMAFLQRAPSHISGDTLNLLGFEGWRSKPDFETDRLIEVAAPSPTCSTVRSGQKPTTSSLRQARPGVTVFGGRPIELASVLPSIAHQK